MVRGLRVPLDEGFFMLVDLDRSAEVLRENPGIAAIEDGVVVVFAEELDGTAKVSVSSFATAAVTEDVADVGGGLAAVFRFRSPDPLIISSAFGGSPKDAQVAGAGTWIVAIWRTAPRAFAIHVWPDNPGLELAPAEGLIDEQAAGRAAELENEQRYEASTGPLRRLVETDQFVPGNRRVVLRSTVRAPARRIIKLWADDTWMEDWNNLEVIDGVEYVVASIIDTKPTLATYFRLMSRTNTRVTFELRWAICRLEPEGAGIDKHVTTAATLIIDAKPEGGDGTLYTLTHEGLPKNALEAVLAFWTDRMAKCDAIVQQ